MSNGGSPDLRSPFFHHASAFGVSGEITRPIQQIIPTQAATTLSMTGGHGSNRVGKYELHGFVSFDSAYVEVGGSLDDVAIRRAGRSVTT